MADQLTLTIRMYDPMQKADAGLSASWSVVNVDRADLTMKQADFVAKYITPALKSISQLKLT